MLYDNDLITVVIPSLGAPHLTKTLNSLLSIGLIYKVIIVLPPGTEFNYGSDKVKVINSNESGQVAQRAFGIKIVSTKFLLLLDDDISVSSDVIFNMYNFCAINENAAVAPILCDSEHNYLVLKKYHGIRDFCTVTYLDYEKVGASTALL